MNNIFKALADPNRRKILKLLREKDMFVGDILENLNITGASLSHHLQILKNADLVLSEKKGQYVEYSLNTTVFQDVLKWIYDITDKDDPKGGKDE
ncbi:MAG: transcriptional regulator [Candidatus Muiribacterium halophilum]|uniref:Transcriptional regulator n=1 Tax=Muiribacterium halophilum TaxID=2053465 RepID=A0A2N5ZA57_MUIH1|nr:MAG: transcriptional regulator [Candidatus Muirbacterium halophilum]